MDRIKAFLINTHHPLKPVPPSTSSGRTDFMFDLPFVVSLSNHEREISTIQEDFLDRTPKKGLELSSRSSCLSL